MCGDYEIEFEFSTDTGGTYASLDSSKFSLNQASLALENKFTDAPSDAAIYTIRYQVKYADY